MAEEAYAAAIENAKRLERKMVEYTPYKGGVDIETTMELEPKEYVDLSYNDLVNQYERNQKIISTAEMGILAAEERKAVAPTAKSEEVESRLREMTTEALKKAEEIAKEPEIKEEAPPPEKPPEVEIELEDVIEIERPEEKPEVPEIEIEKPERKPPEVEIELEKPKVPEIEIEKPERKPPEVEIELEKPEVKPPERKPPEKPEVPKFEVPVERKAAPPPVPPALVETPDEAAAKRYQQMEKQIRDMVGAKADELTLKKKMLELTKQLFKEKITSNREKLKLQITVLKNMLISAKAAPAKPGVMRRRDETHAKLFDTIMSTQQAEIAQKKDEIVGSYNKKVATIKKKFYDDIAMAEDPAKRKKIYEGFVFSVTTLVEQLPADIRGHADFVTKKHAAEMQKLRGSISEKDKETIAKVEERLGHISKDYGTEFSAVKGIVGREIDNLIEVTGGEIFKAPEEEPKEKEVKALEVVKEINETDEGTLLYHLHSVDPAYYKKYERKQISRAEAIFKAKALFAKEKGLSASMVKRYFSQTED